MATSYSMPTDESLVRVAEAIEAGNGLLQRVTGGYVMFCSTKPDESSITSKPCLVVVTTTGEMYLVADDLAAQTSAKEDAWPDDEEGKQNYSWGEEEEDEPSANVAESKAAGTGTEASAAEEAPASHTEEADASAEPTSETEAAS